MVDTQELQTQHCVSVDNKTPKQKMEQVQMVMRYSSVTQLFYGDEQNMYSKLSSRCLNGVISNGAVAPKRCSGALMIQWCLNGPVVP